jgi:hypothetical protein
MCWKYGEDVIFTRLNFLVSCESFRHGSTNGSIWCGIDHVRDALVFGLKAIITTVAFSCVLFPN